jgi:hypothetical protein
MKVIKRVESVGMLLLAAALSQLAHVSPAQVPGKDSYTMAMGTWEKSEKLSISPKARDVIAYSFQQQNQLIADFGGNRVWKDSDRTLKQTLVIYYLSDLRDLKAGSVSQIYPAPMEMNKNPDGMKDRTATGEMKVYGIDASDVSAYPVEKFLYSIEPVLKGPKGELHVISEPTGAAITLDNASRGYTVKITVESAGDHRIVVSNKKGSMRCADKVNVPEGGSITFHCP